MSQRRIKKKRLEEKVLVGKTEVEMLPVVKHSIKQILKDNWKFLVIISIGIFLLYVNGIKGDFVSDDYATILNNPDVKVFGSFIGGPTPVTVSTYLLAVIFGVYPIVYHLFSVFLYIVACWVAVVFLNFIVSKRTTWLVMVIFAVLPIHVEAVTWISGKPYLVIAIFIMICFMLIIKYLEDNKLAYLLITFPIFGILFLADKPRPLSLFPVLLLYLIIVNKKYYWQRLRKIWIYLAGLAVVALILALPLIIDRVNVVNGGVNASDSVFYNPFFQYPTGIAKYLQVLLVPVDLTLYHTMYTFPVWLNWLILLDFLALITYSYFRNKRIFFALTFFLLTLLPSMAPVKVSWLVAERYAFLPSLGFCLFLAVIFESLWQKIKYVTLLPLGIMLIYFSYRTFIRNIDWTTNHKLWVNTCQVSPNSHNAWNNIGDDYDKLKDYPDSIKGFTQSTIVKPNYADAYHNRANIFFKTGRLDLARESYNIALNFSPDLFQTYLSLTQIDLMENQINLALTHSQKAVQLQPNNPQSAYVLGVVYAQAGNLDQAEMVFKTILESYPQYKLASDALANIAALKVGVTK